MYSKKSIQERNRVAGIRTAHLNESESGENNKSSITRNLNMQSSSDTQGKLDILDKKILYGLFSKNPQRLIDRENDENLVDDKHSH